MYCKHETEYVENPEAQQLLRMFMDAKNSLPSWEKDEFDTKAKTYRG